MDERYITVMQQKARALADSAHDLRTLEQTVREFDECALKKSANHTVFADGAESASVMLIGEAPGMNEDKYGVPFCGQSGKLLDNMLMSIGLDRAAVYITNTIFWRPPNNRRPTPQEILMCRPFVEKHIALVRPLIVVLVGSTAVESLMMKSSSEINMHKLRGQYWDYTNCYMQTTQIDCSCTLCMTTIFHPSYLLRNLVKKKEMWMDLLGLKAKLTQLTRGSVK